MRVTIPTLAIATLLGGGLPAVAELGPCKADAQQTPLCGSGKGAARVVHDTISTDKKSRWPGVIPTRTPLPSPRTTATSSCYHPPRRWRRAGESRYRNFRNPGQYANRREEYAIWSPDSRMLIRQYDIRFGTDVYRLYRIGADGALSGEIDLDKMIEDAVYARLQKIGRKRDDYSMFYTKNGSTLGNDGTLRFKVVAFIVKKDREVDYDVVIEVTPGATPLRARIVKIVQTHAE